MDNTHDICSICLNNNNNNNNFAITPCGHKFCFNCIIQSLQTIYTCPYCRTVLLEDNNEEPEEPVITLREKIILYFKRLYNEGPTNKELLFIILTLLSYQSYYIIKLADSIKNSIILSHCFLMEYTY